MAVTRTTEAMKDDGVLASSLACNGAYVAMSGLLSALSRTTGTHESAELGVGEEGLFLQPLFCRILYPRFMKFADQATKWVRLWEANQL